MTPRPPTHREPPPPEGYRKVTDKDIHCLPEGSIVWNARLNKWIPSQYIGSKSCCDDFYAVPITGQEAPTLHEPITREALNKDLRERDGARAEAAELMSARSAENRTWLAGQALATLRAEDFNGDAWADDMASQAVSIADAVQLRLSAVTPLVRPNPAACGQCADKL